MGAIAQSGMKAGALLNRRGIALPSGILAIVAVGVLVAGLFSMTDLGAKAVNNRESSNRALQVAEAGAAHALGLMRNQFRGTRANNLLRGFDQNWSAATDNGLLINYPVLTSTTNIPAAGRAYGGGIYTVKIKDDPADPIIDAGTDGNFRLLLECNAVMPDGATANVNVIVSHMMLPGVALNGNLEVAGQLNITGACGGAHVNGAFTGGGQPSAATEWSSTAGTIPSEFEGTKMPGALPLVIPNLNPMANCPVGAKTSLPSNLNTINGVYCITGDVFISNDIGSSSSYKTATIIATGNISISGKPFLKSAHLDGFVLMAGGDLKIDGDGGFDGISYCGAQTAISGKPTFKGQLVCNNAPWPHPGGSNLVPSNLISGDAEVDFDCTSTINRPYRLVAWYPSQGN